MAWCLRAAAVIMPMLSEELPARDGQGALGSQQGPGVHAEHVAQFYDREEFLTDAVAAFIAAGLARREPLVVICSAPHRALFRKRISGAGLDWDEACDRALLHCLDAHELLRAFMTEDGPSERRFREVVGAIVHERVRAGGERQVRAYGEMVDLLWREGRRDDALELERLWNELLREQPVMLLCSYAMDNFRSEADSEVFARICREHARVVPAEGYSLAGSERDRAREVSRLQQRARALEAEIERREELEAALREAVEKAERANRVKSEFLAVVSHELRTPLNAITGYNELLDQEVGGTINDVQRRYVGRIRGGAQQLLTLIEQILSRARLEAGQEEVVREPVDVMALAAEARAMVELDAKEKGLELRLRGPSTEARCVTDKGKLRQILLNLLSNAVKFTRQGHVELAVHAANGDLRFDVSDTGPGIEPERLNEIFDPFVQLDTSATRRHGGTGLGLAVSRELARLLGGDIEVTSERGRGTIFSVRVPADRAVAYPPARRPQA